MDGLNNLLGDLSSSAQADEDRRAARDARLTSAKSRAQRLAAQLAPLFPVVAAATKTPEGLNTWCDAWARQIENARLSDAELSRGLGRLGEFMVASGNPPLSFPLFLSACRPDAHLSATDHEARQARPPLLTRDRLQDPGWCSARDAALAKLKAMGTLRGQSSD